MKSLLTKIALVLSMVAATSPALADGILIPVDRGDSQGTPYTSGPVLLKVLNQNQPALNNKLSIIYEGHLKHVVQSSGSPVYVGLAINGRALPSTRLVSSRNGLGVTISLDGVENGQLELYFFDQNNNYDSQFGENYRFELFR